jgi:hypothetical protein
MQLKDKGDTITIVLTVPEAKLLGKAHRIARKIALVPTHDLVNQAAEQTRDGIEELLAALSPNRKPEAEEA